MKEERKASRKSHKEPKKRKAPSRGEPAPKGQKPRKGSSDPEPAEASDEGPAEEGLRFPIVGIGASAGGLKALQGLFEHVPADNGLAFVVVQHLDPKHESIMSSILARHTRMEVQEIADGILIEPNRVYVKPPGKDVIIAERALRLLDPPQGPAPYLPIDTFFRSLAQNLGEQAICIILSGAGRDGTLGLKMIKGAGGLSIVQDEAQAEYAGMPGSAIGTGQADFILPVERMAEEILQYTRHPSISRPRAESRGPRAETDYQKILMSVRTTFGTDFSHYKRSTIRRRIERRLALHQIETLGDYLPFLRDKPEEVHALFRDLTINVTSFFRDPEAWEALRSTLGSRLLAGKQEGEELRAWVVGCSTGEEAYSLAILLLELIEEAGKQLRVKIFATDVNGDAIETARSGAYPEAIAADVRPDRLERFFVKQEASYRARDTVREMVVFAEHDLTRDPPFSQLDLVTCRNLLIYMDGALQRNVIPLLHYGLRPGGLLMLGTSESVGGFDDLFSPFEGRWKMYRALKADTEKYLGHMRLTETDPESARERRRKEPKPEELEAFPRRPAEGVREMVERMISERFTPPAVLVDQDLRVLYFHGDTDKYLAVPKGEPEFQLLKLARRELQYRLRKALREAADTGKTVQVEGTQVSYGGRFLDVDLAVIPFREREASYLLVTFEERPAPADTKQENGEASENAIRSLRHELYATRQDLQATIEELETANEELKSANEELQANNEELQSTNEELETSREELQSTNEELETVNAELQKKNELLGRAHDDIQNLFAATGLGTIFLDIELRIKRFTPAVKRVFNLIDSDVGRPITDLASRLNYAGLADDARRVLDSLERRERDVPTTEGHWYSVDVRPYRTSENLIEGVVITFTNITARKQAEVAKEEAQSLAASLLETINEPVLLLSRELLVVSANQAYYRAFQSGPQDTEGRSLEALGAGQWNVQELRARLERLLEGGPALEDLQVELDVPRLGRRRVRFSTRCPNPAKPAGLIVLAIGVAGL